MRTLPQEELTIGFTQADLRTLGDLSINLGRLYWQEDVGPWKNQVAILLKQQEKLNNLVALLLSKTI